MDPRLLQQREHLRRGFNISHQKVVLEVDFSGSLWGYTEITVIPTSKDLKTLYFHSRQCQIHTVTVSGHTADFTHTDPLSNISLGNSTSSNTAEAADCHRHPELKRKLYSAMQEGDEGELAVALPREVIIRKEVGGSGSNGISGGLVSEAATPEPQTPGPAGVEYAPLTVNIAYSLRNPVDGFEFVLPTDAYPHRVPHAYTTPSSPDSARCWVPCIDNPWEKCTWEFEFVVPRYLEEREPGQEEEEEENGDSYPTLVVCSGELVEQIAHPYNSNKTIFLFSQATPTSVQHVAFAAGPFHLLSIPAELTAEETTSTAAQPLIYAFCLPGQESMLATSTSSLRSAMSFYSTDFGSYPFGSYKVVFVDQLPTQRFDSATLSLVTVDLLHGDDAIEQAIESRHALAHALACQWVGVNIQPKNWSDLWLVNGLALYITGLFMKKLLGNNEYRFRLKKDMQRTVEWDVGGMPPICQPQNLDPPDSATLPFINLKAPLVLHILDRKLGKSGTALGLSRVLPKLFLSAISGEMMNNTLSTHAFLRICRKVSGVDLRSFAEQWIYGSGCPSFGFSATFNRKKMAVEITMRQDCPAYKAMEGNEVSKLLMKPVAFFEGTMTIRIHEADGTPYEHVLDIRSPFKRYEVPFNTKYKRVRRNTKRYLARQAAAQAAAEGDAEAAEAMGMVDMGFGLDVWEKEQERENWKVADWTEEDESVMSGATYEWIRMDADFEWIAGLKFDQPDFMWVSQLQRDRDVVAQLEAINALTEKPTAIVSSTLTKTVLVSNYYFRIRCEAVLAIVTCAIKKLDFLGLFHLFKLFLRYCYEPEDANQDLFAHTYVPKPNDFSDFAEYFVRKSLVSAISRVRFETGKSPSIVRQFLIDQLRYNDNTANPYSDGLYICALISAAATSSVCVAPPERGELLPSEVRNELNAEDATLLNKAVAEVDRYRSMDRLIPSTHNCVTVAALEFYMVLGVAGLIPNHPRVFFPLTREGHYTQVRIAAFDGLFLTKWYAPPIMRYVFAVMANDPSRVVRRHVARSACHSLALLLQMGEMKSGMKETESLLIEEDGSVPSEKLKELKKSEMDVMIKVLRKDREVGKNEALREFLMPVALAPDVDHEVRWCVLKLADILIKPTEEMAPTVKIHIPSTPVLESAPSLPSIKAPAKATRPIKGLSTPTIKSPLIPFNAPSSKIKLPASPALDVPQTPSLSRAESKRNVVFATPALPPSVSNKNKLKAKAKLSQPDKPQKPEKPSHVPKAQGGGMSLNDLRASRNALKKLKTNKHAVCFLQPVDPIRDQAPSYFEIIKQPMDLSTMGAKLEAGMYKDRFAFQADFRLMVSNAKRYNMPGSYVHNEAIALETFFEKQWTIINKTLEAASKHQAAMQPPPAAPRILPPVPKAFASPAPASKPPVPATPIAATPAPARPTIKLKVGSQSNHVEASPALATPSAKPRKVKTKEPKEPQPVDRSSPDAPPPPYVDDGSHDILQEVLAIEREKSEKRIRSEKVVKDKERPVANGTSNKRKKDDSGGISEDDILALATPSKKERPTPPAPGPSTSISIKPRMVIPATTKSTPTPEPSKTGRNSESAPPRKPSTSRDIPKISLKGKEKEKESSAPPAPPTKAHRDSSVKPSRDSSVKPHREESQSAIPINEKKCRELMKTLQRLPEAAIFARPVDPVLDGCPTYLQEIAHPMDFGTMLHKLGQNKYITMDDFAKDMNLVFANCRQFNPPGTYPVDCASTVEKAFKKEWPKALERKLSWTEKRGLQGIMTNLVKESIAWIFLEPVDPVLLGIPTYFDVIPRKNARDLKTIRQKLDADKYDTVEVWEADLELMIDNAITFNGLDSEVGQIAVSMRNRMHEVIDAWKSGSSKKRKDGDNKVTQPSKKAKVV